MKKCCFCGKEIKGWGNNPWGAVEVSEDGKVVKELTFGPEDECCDECNITRVIPGRLYKLNRMRGN